MRQYPASGATAAQQPSDDPLNHPNAQAALRLADLGLPVFPANADKRPLVKWREASTSDPNAVERLWRAFSGALPAIDCGKANLLVIDCDRHGGPDGVAAFRTLVGAQQFPVAVETPNGGQHIYFCQPDGEALGNSTGTLPAGIDVRGNGGYVIAPGAVLPDGRCYSAARFDPSQIGALPQAILERIRSGHSLGSTVTPFRRTRLAIGDYDARERAFAKSALHACVRDLQHAKPGTRNGTLNAVAYRMGRMIGAGWIEQGDVFAALIGATAANGLAADDGERQILATVRSGLLARIAKPHPPLDEEPAASADHKPSALHSGLHSGGLNLLSPMDAANAPPRAYLWKGVLGAGEFSVLFGEPGCGKSFLATHIAYAIAQGRALFGRRVRQGPVVYCGLEGGRGIAKRIRALLNAYGDAPDFRYLAKPIAILDNDGAVEALIEAARSIGATLVIIDTLARAMAGGDENSPEDMGAMIRAFDRIREETGAHVMAVHHGGKDEARGSRGHSSLKGAADAELKAARNEDGARVATVTKSKDDTDGERFPFRLTVHDLGLDEDGEPVTTCLVEEELAASKATDAQRSKPLTASQRIAFEALTEALAEAGELAPSQPRVPHRQRAVNEDLWRRYAYQRGISGGDPDAKRMAFKRAVAALLAAHRVGTWDGLYWTQHGHT
jgi:hypothetical protein